MSRFDRIEDVWAFLDQIPKFQESGASAANFSFDNLLAFFDLIGNPHRELPAVHIAGTNGKGTTGYLLETVYHEAGYSTGLFTSPHLIRYNERIRVDMEEIPNEALLEFFNAWGNHLEDIRLSYFEISTVIAFWYFRKMKVDLAIIETGLGGRLDSTNIIQPLLSVITSVGLDHQDILGDSLEEIAGEKAGIIKKSTPVIIGKMPEAAEQVCEAAARKRKAPIVYARSAQPEWNEGVISLNKPEISFVTHFRESINMWNIATVWEAKEILSDRYPVSDPSFKTAIENFKGAPGRFEKIHPKYDWYFSGSHNKDALNSSLNAVKELKAPEETVLVFSAMKDKVTADFLDNFRYFGKRYFVEQSGDRAAKFDDIKKQISTLRMDESNAGIILNELKSELVIFMGSFYFYPIVRRWTQNVS
ncbi:bifunctional folylpolyglutamate synthase/dihydrofolate synthase [Gracilimonas amylolytica]|uniref:bifunctional folylpolyglutamate synthase/dihydrofolate synthase n=1 Tax=Gracilimonas amylolytica TaxID=1749045 RepID=UPI000CD98154|nr:Mur ligase family protein [Gracilimonas amylolytica]